MRLDVEVGHQAEDGHGGHGQLPVTFTDKIIVIENGPKRDCCYNSRVQYVAEQNFKESVLIKPRLVPVRYRTTVVADNCHVNYVAVDVCGGQNGDFTQQPEDELNQNGLQSFDEFDNCAGDASFDVRFYEEIYLLPKMVPEKFESTVYSYPKESKKSYETVFNYSVNSKDKIYVTGVNYHSGVNLVDLGVSSKYLSHKHKLVEGANNNNNNNNGFLASIGNGVDVTNEKISIHDAHCGQSGNDQSFISTKELTIIKGIAVTDV